MSIWTISPNFSGKLMGVVFLLLRSMVAVDPISKMGSVSMDEME